MSAPASDGDRPRWQLLKSIFAEALEIESESERESFLQNSCAGDPDLLAQARRLLAIHEETGLAVDHAPAGALALSSLIPAPLSDGQIVANRFRIVRRLGAGGMGEVYEAADTALGETRLALKTIRPAQSGNAVYAGRFKQELQLLRVITHSNVCRVFDFFPATGADTPAFFTMELIEGETLAARLQRAGPLTPKEAAGVFAQILRGLDAAHTAGVIHRDLKPSNIMLAPAGDGNDLRVVLMDFGIARDAHAESSVETSLSQGAIMGTPAYMSPEQLRGEPVSRATDIYSFGVAAYEALTGFPPFTGPSPLAIVAQKLGTAPVAVVESGTQIPDAWRGIIERCLAHDPAERFATAIETAEALERSQKVYRWPFRRKRRGRSRRPRMALLAGALLVAAALAVAVAPMFRQRQSEEGRRLYQDGVTALADGSLLRSSRLFEAAIERDPGYALAHARRAQALASLDSPDLARDSLLRAMELRNRAIFLSAYDRNTFDAIRALVTRDFATAAERFTRAVAMAPSTARVPALLDLGAAQEAAEQRVPAVETYQQVLAQEPNIPTAHLRLGTLAARRSDLTAALAAFERALRGYELLGNSEGIAETWIRRGQAYTRVSRFPEARDAMETGRRYAESNRLASHEVRARFGLSAIALGAGDMGEARRLAEEALALARSQKQESQIIFAMNDLANAHLTQLKLKETEYLARQSLELAERFRQPQSAARARLLLMNTLYFGGGSEAMQEARSLGNQALDFYRQAGDRRRQVDVLLMLGRLENRSDRFAAAIPMFESASQTAAAVDDPQSTGLAEQGLAASSVALGRIPQAIEHAHRAAEAYRKSKQSGSLAYALLTEGEQRLELGQAEGDDILQQAAQLAAKNPRLSATIALVRADHHARKGAFDKADGFFRQAASFKEDESPGWIARKAAVEARLSVNDNRPHALALCRSALALVDKGLAFDFRSSVLLTCADAAGSAGRFLAPALTRLAATAEASGNHAVAWRAWQAIATADPSARASQQSDKHWRALQQSWGEAAARAYAR